MSPAMQNVQTIDAYIQLYPKDVQVLLEKMRETIKKVEPTFEETISYGIPTFRLNGKNIVHFGAYPHHIGFYPTPNGIEAFKKELAEYASGKGTVKFPLDKPIPFDLVTRITKFRLAEATSNRKK